MVTKIVEKLIHFNVQIAENQEGNNHDMLSILTELDGLGVNLSLFLRSLLIQRYSGKSWKERDLIQKQFFFQNFGEVYLQTFLSNLWMKKYGMGN